MSFTAITAFPFEADQIDLYEQQLAARYNEILALLTSYSAISFQNGEAQYIFHPSAKTAGRFQLTVFRDGFPLSDTQHDTPANVAKMLSEFPELKYMRAV